MSANLPPSAVVQTSPSEIAASAQPSMAEQVARNHEVDKTELVAATIQQRMTNKHDLFDFVSWYSNVCTQSFADGLSALQQGHDSSHAQPSLISKCVRMSAFAFEADQAVLQTLYQPEHMTPFQHACQWL